MTKPAKQYRYQRPRSNRSLGWLIVLAMVLLGAAAYVVNTTPVTSPDTQPLPTAGPLADRGRVLSVEGTTHYTATEAAALAHENYGATTPPVTTGVTKITFRYRSYDLDGAPLAVYGRAYLPDATATVSDARLPVWAFAPGTTGIGDQCAASLEQPKVSNWGNYDSHMVMYATQGYAGVITDYEGMRDPARLHHYMVGELEGRAVLDSIRALRRLPQAVGRLDPNNVFLGGYSQGGHAAFWADAVAPTYAADISVKGVVGFGPVMSVKDTLADVTHAANINWFGPYVLTSYSDYYHQTYGLSRLLQPPWTEHLRDDVQAHCIDTVLNFWGHNPAAVYTPELIQAMSSGDWSAYPELSRDLDRNATGSAPTASAKRINEGAEDNVVLPRQQQAILPTLCATSHGPVQYAQYPGTTHYNAMVHSLADTLAWLQQLRAGVTPTSTCSSLPTLAPTLAPTL